MSEELKPCPFCGGLAELDTSQAYRALSSGAFGFGSDRGNERVGWHGRVPPPSTSAHFRCEFCHQEHLDCTEIQHTEGCPVNVARAALRSLSGAKP